MFGHFLRERGGLPDSKDDEEHFCFYLDIFQVKFGGITKVQTLRGTLVCIKSGFEKSSSKDSKKQGGVKAKLKKTKQKQIFFLDGFPYSEGPCR